MSGAALKEDVMSKPGKFSIQYETTSADKERADAWFALLKEGEVCGVRTWHGPLHLVKVVSVEHREDDARRVTVRSLDGRNICGPHHYALTQVVFRGRCSIEHQTQNNSSWGCALWPLEPAIAGSEIRRVAIRQVVHPYEVDLFSEDGPEPSRP